MINVNTMDKPVIMVKGMDEYNILDLKKINKKIV